MVYLIYLLIVVAFIDTFTQLPIISPFAEGIGASALMIGVIIGMYSFTNIAGNMVAGIYIDKRGAKGMLTVGLLLTGIILIFYSFVTTPIQLLLVRVFHGFTGGLLVPTAFTYLANHNAQVKQGKTMALSGAGVGIASVIGPAYGGIVGSNYGPQTVFISISILMIVTAVIAYFFLPEKTVKSTRSLNTDDTAKIGIAVLFKRAGLLISYGGAFALMLGQGILAYALPLRIEGLGFNSSLSGILLSSFAITATLIFILPTNRIFDRFSQTSMMMIGLIILSISLFMLEFAGNIGFLFGIMVFYGIGFALIFPSINALVAMNTGLSERGRAYGLFYSFFSLGVVGGSIFTGIFIETALGVFAAGSILVLICILVLAGIHQWGKGREEDNVTS